MNYIRLMQSETAFAVNIHQQEGYDDSGQAECCEYQHGGCEINVTIRGGVLSDDIANKHRDKHQTDVLNKIDDAIGRAQLLERHYLGHTGPHRCGNKRERDTVEYHHQ